jgi:hypothetical protein
MRYIIWSPAKVQALTGKDIGTYKELHALEEATGYSYSSIIDTPNIEAVANAFMNEADCYILYIKLITLGVEQ